MKNMIKRIIVGVAIALIVGLLSGCKTVNAQEVVYLEPKKSFISYCQIASGSNCNTSLTSTLPTTYLYNATWYSHDISLPVGNYISRVSWNYDLSSFDDEYISFLTYYIGSSPSALLDGRPCDVYYGQNFTSYPNGYINIPNGFNIISCPNSKKADSWLDLYYQNTTNPATANTIFSSLILNWVNTFSKYGELTASINANTDAVNETNSFLKDTSSPNTSDMDFSDKNATNGVISDLVTMPIRLVQSFLNGFNSTCTPFNLGNLFGTDLVMPCINIGTKLGFVWNIIDTIISGLFIYVFGKSCVKKFNDITNMKDNQIDEVFD